MSASSRPRLLALLLGLAVLLAPGTAAARGGDDPASAVPAALAAFTA